MPPDDAPYRRSVIETMKSNKFKIGQPCFICLKIISQE